LDFVSEEKNLRILNILELQRNNAKLKLRKRQSKSKQNNKGLQNKFNVHSAQNTHKINLKNKETSRMIALREK